MSSDIVVCLFGNALFIAVFVCSNNIRVCLSNVALILVFVIILYSLQCVVFLGLGWCCVFCCCV